MAGVDILLAIKIPHGEAGSIAGAWVFCLDQAGTDSASRCNGAHCHSLPPE